jgi:outer membrane receptor protein involved in Fe transport
LASNISAGVTGKVSGVVIDEKTDQPLVGATVRVNGTSLATKTDVDGEYFIINVPSGKYDITVSSVGFEPVVKKEVRVLVDLTTPVDFSMKEQAIELGQKVVVYADNPIIQKDLTASKVIFTADRLKTLPNIITVQSVLTNYPGVVIDRDNSIHIRGGRSGQVSYYYDGFSVQDPFVLNSGIHIMPNSLEELTLTSGGYTAEYGEALSGIVSAVSREGGSNYSGNFKMYQGFTQPYDVNGGKLSNLKRIDNRSASFNLAGPMPYMNPNADNFSVAGEYLHDPSYLPHNGIASYTGSAKLSMQPLQKLRLITSGTYYQSNGEIYQHRDVNGRSYDFNLDGLPIFKKESYLIGMSGNYHAGTNTILSMRVNRFYTRTKSAPAQLFDTYWTNWPGYSVDSNGVYNGTIQDSNYGNNPDYSDPMQLVGFTAGSDFDPTFRFRQSEYTALHGSIIDQIDKRNELKAGVEYRRYSVNWDFKQFFNSRPYGELYSSKPTYLSVFAQDKMEYDAFIINVGMRYDYRNSDISYNITPFAETSTFKKASAKGHFSPRLGVSFPISEKSVMHFNYGVYYQAPQFTYLYTNTKGDVSSGYPLLGNPDLEPERTISYEVGLVHLIGQSVKLDATAYYKDINDLVTTRSTFKIAGNSVTSFVNGDYGSVKGLDIQLEKLAGNGYLSGSISYGYMIAKGNGSYALEPYYTFLTSTEDTLAPVTEYPLDFDQRHTITGVVDFRVPRDSKARLFGVKVPTEWGVNVVGHYGSGLPYTLTDVSGLRLGDRNAGRLPANYTVDMRLNKDFRFSMNNYLVSFFVEVDNLFNRQNVIQVYPLTGRPDYDGSTPTATLATNQQEINHWDSLYDKDPQNFSPPRTIRTGLEFNF